MAQALGQLSNAPLIYVLAQVVFTRVPKMASLWEDFHQEVFEEFPEAKVQHIRELQIGDTADPSISDIIKWNLVNREQSEGIILGADSLIFHVTSYQTSAIFFNKLHSILTKLGSILPDNVEVNRLGLRYVDLLLPTKTLSVDEQVSGKLGSIPLDEAGCEFKKLEEVTRYTTPEGGDLVIRHRQSTEKDILPGDLFPNILKTASRLEEVAEEGAVVGMMDYDHYTHQKFSFDAKAIITKLGNMHVTSSNAFRLTTTEDAKKIWNGE
jgi:uncharacterized protein (TIGR04255 family)